MGQKQRFRRTIVWRPVIPRLPTRPAAFALFSRAKVRRTQRQQIESRHPSRGRADASEKAQEEALSHSITSSADVSRISGTFKPRAFAVLRLITRLNLVGCSTGSSAGLVPFRMRETRKADRR